MLHQQRQDSITPGARIESNSRHFLGAFPPRHQASAASDRYYLELQSPICCVHPCALAKPSRVTTVTISRRSET
jgi:hypothetical protein